MFSDVPGEAVNPIQSSFVLNDPNENAAFLPFGSGIRACVGQKFVIQGVATLFASLLERYEVCDILLLLVLYYYYFYKILFLVTFDGNIIMLLHYNLLC